MATPKDVKTMNTAVIAFVIAAIIASVFIFGLNKNAEGHSGFEIIFHQGGGYLVLMLVFLALAGVAVFFGIRQYNKTQNAVWLVALGIVAVILVGIGVGKGCTDKANDGVTGPGGRPATTINN